jgi:hypothetical protein
MSQPPKTNLTLERFETLLDAYGAAPERWPSAERAAAEALVKLDARAHELHQSALALDGQLEQVEVDEPSARLRARVLEIPIRHPRERAARHAPRYSGWRLTLLALVPCVLGFFSGALWLNHPDSAEDDTWNDVAQMAFLTDLDVNEEDAP